jgi:hypothetical protein
LRDLPKHHAHSVTHLDEFLGQDNVTILEFVNPSNFHFLAIQLDHIDVVGEGDWVGGDSWFEGEFIASSYVFPSLFEKCHSTAIIVNLVVTKCNIVYRTDVVIIVLSFNYENSSTFRVVAM